MKVQEKKKLGYLVGALLAGTSLLAFVTTAKAELVFDEDESQIRAADIKMESDLGEPTAAKVQEEVEPEVDYNDPRARRNSVETIRRSRMREELKNEDLVQRRLEQLRLRDEKRRLDHMGFQEPKTEAAPVAPVVQPVQEQVVVVPATDAISTSQSGVTADGDLSADIDEDYDEDLNISVMSTGGFSGMDGTGGYNVVPRFSAGIGAGMDIGDHLGVTLGYSYTEYGVKMASAHPFVQDVQFYSGSSPEQFETLAMKQNVVDFSVRGYILSKRYRLRPYAGVGLAYAKSYINYDQQILNAMTAAGAPVQDYADYELDQFLAPLSVGLNVELSRNVSIGAHFKYYLVLASRENQEINNGAFAPAPGVRQARYTGYGYEYANAANIDKQVVGGSLAESRSYSLLLGVNITF